MPDTDRRRASLSLPHRRHSPNPPAHTMDMDDVLSDMQASYAPIPQASTSERQLDRTCLLGDGTTGRRWDDPTDSSPPARSRLHSRLHRQHGLLHLRECSSVLPPGSPLLVAGPGEPRPPTRTRSDPLTAHSSPCLPPRSPCRPTERDKEHRAHRREHSPVREAHLARVAPNRPDRLPVSRLSPERESARRLGRGGWRARIDLAQLLTWSYLQ